jgi:hypothetical protein
VQPAEQTKVLGEVVGADQDQGRSPEPRPYAKSTPAPGTVPAATPPDRACSPAAGDARLATRRVTLQDLAEWVLQQAVAERCSGV